MPNYVYDCQACGKTHEAFHSIQAPALVDCPFCGKPQLKRRILGGAGLLFKGSGFYETDYKRKAAPKEGGPDQDSAAKPSGGCAQGPGCGACSGG